MRNIALLFCGGGAQYPGMMKDFYETIPACKNIFMTADKVSGRDLTSLILEGTMEDLSVTSTMIPAVFTADVVAYTALTRYDIKPVMAAGFSLGEWAAITAAGVLPFEAALELVQFRSDEMTKATPPEGAGMAVIMGKPDQYVEELCSRVTEGYVCPANYNYPGQITVSGTDLGLKALEELADAEKTIYKRLPVNVPSHCELMKPAMKALENRLKDVHFSSPAFPIVSNNTALPTTNEDEIKQNITEQLVSPVLFAQSILKMYSLGIDTFIELGPGKTLSSFTRKIFKKNNTESDIVIKRVENTETLMELMEAVQHD